MSTIRKEVVRAALGRSYNLIDYNIHNDFHKEHEFRQQTILADKSLAEDEKAEAMKLLNKTYDHNKVLYNSGIKRICENCKQECLATLYCEYCVRNNLKANFPNWTSGNNEIDNLIQTCQMKAIIPSKIVEWIPYDNFENIKYLTEGGCSEIYTASWIGGTYKEWDSKIQQLKRFGSHNVVLKKLENVENANQSWLEEVKSHLTISNKWNNIAQCFGLTKDLSDGSYMLVMRVFDTDLRNYLQQNHNKITWQERIQIAHAMIDALVNIHKENAIHRDLHSGNILFQQVSQLFNVSDLGFCGPADKSSKSIYGNLPYISPEVISGKGYTFESDIYSFGMLMWEISAGRPPFSEYKHDFDFVTNIINGMRPKIVPETPLEYERLIKQCWDADPSKRPDSYTLWKKIREIKIQYQNTNIPGESIQLKANNDLHTNYTSRIFGSKVHQFENIPEPKNATEEEREALHYKSKVYDFGIPDNIENLDESNNQNKDNSKNLSIIFDKLQIGSKDDNQDDYYM